MNGTACAACTGTGVTCGGSGGGHFGGGGGGSGFITQKALSTVTFETGGGGEILIDGRVIITYSLLQAVDDLVPLPPQVIRF